MISQIRHRGNPARSGSNCPCCWVQALMAHFRSRGYVPHCWTFNAGALSQMLQWEMLIKCSNWSSVHEAYGWCRFCNLQVVLVFREGITRGERRFLDEPLPPPAGQRQHNTDTHYSEVQIGFSSTSRTFPSSGFTYHLFQFPHFIRRRTSQIHSPLRWN